MLDQAEKAYCLALEALEKKDYRAAISYFDRAASRFGEEGEFKILHETCRVLVALKQELRQEGAAADKRDFDVEEVFSDG